MSLALALFGLFVLFQNCSPSEMTQSSTQSLDSVEGGDDGFGRDANSSAHGKIVYGDVTLAPSQSLIYSDVQLVYQGDGNLVVYRRPVSGAIQVLWSAYASANCAVQQCQMVFRRNLGIQLLAGGNVYWRSGPHPSPQLDLVLSDIAPFLSINSAPANNVVWTGVNSLNWFSVLDTVAGGQNAYGLERPGVADYTRLFSNPEEWSETLKHIHVFKVYSQFIIHASPQDLRTLFDFLRARRIALAIEHGAIELTPEELQRCGVGIEGVAGVGYADLIARKVRDAGGKISFLAMDEPFYYSHFHVSNLPPPRVSCRFSISELARRATASFRAVQAYFPEVIVGDIEPFFVIRATDWFTKYAQFLREFKDTSGAPIAFVHDDVVNLDADWLAKVRTLQPHLTAERIPYGMIWNGGLDDLNSRPSLNTDTKWISSSIAKMQKYEALQLPPAFHNAFQSWEKYPAYALPENSPATLTYTSNYFFKRKYRQIENLPRRAVFRFFNQQTNSYLFDTDSSAKPGYRLEGPTFEVFSNSSPHNNLRVNSCRVIGGLPFLSTAPAICENQTLIKSLGYVSAALSFSTSSPLYRCRHILTGTYLVTPRPQECLSSTYWAVEGVVGYGQ